ncbi:hypothetical protein MVEN_00094800 [Mycena venus]|uniref:Uncharacterized protein n=1 Tax=Mycena venus TaxID=2733690 RepID=A0A8H6Z8P6_9AGAR|nr:hypothetical protein MVEN_00094800 [Mycena venus]
MSGKLFLKTTSKPNADRKTFTNLVYLIRGTQTQSPVCSFQSQSFVTAEWWDLGVVIKSGYIGFDNGSLEKLTIKNFGFEGSPERQTILWPRLPGVIFIRLPLALRI